METIKTERLLLRRLKKEDVADMFEYTSDAETVRLLKWDAHSYIEQTMFFIENTLSDYEAARVNHFVWGIELTQNHKLIGSVRIFDIDFNDKKAEVSYILNALYSNNGYMSEAVNAVIRYAFDSINLIRIQAKCVAENAVSEKVMIKCAMSFEGLFRKASFIKGEHYDLKYYAITKG